jgi:hypothetical protein
MLMSKVTMKDACFGLAARTTYLYARREDIDGTRRRIQLKSCLKTGCEVTV